MHNTPNKIQKKHKVALPVQMILKRMVDRKDQSNLHCNASLMGIGIYVGAEKKKNSTLELEHLPTS